MILRRIILSALVAASCLLGFGAEARGARHHRHHGHHSFHRHHGYRHHAYRHRPSRFGHRRHIHRAAHRDHYRFHRHRHIFGGYHHRHHAYRYRHAVRFGGYGHHHHRGFHRYVRFGRHHSFSRHYSGGGSGLASWYTGRRTASGERYGGFTAAHRSYPFGTRVRVTNTNTGRSVVVRINDRGPFVRGRVIDLSRASARAIGVSGVSRVALKRL